MPIYLYITPFFPSKDSWRGGFCLDAVRAVQRTRKYDVRVVVMNGGCDYDFEGIHVIGLKWKSLPLEIAPYLTYLRNKKILLKTLNDAGIDLSQVTVCHSNVYPEPSYILKQAKPSIKAVWQTHRMGEPFNLAAYRIGTIPGLSDLQYLYWKRMLEGIDVVALLSDRHREVFGKAFPNGPLGSAVDLRTQTIFKRYAPILPHKMVVFYNGIDTEVFKPVPKVNGSEQEFVIGCVANFGPTKGQMTLLRAVRRLIDKIPGLKLKFVGSGLMLDLCKAYVAENGLGEMVEFIKECDHLMLPELYRGFSLFVLPTICEGFCCTLVEAVGCGVPAIATNAVSFEEVIPSEDKDKWLCKPLDDSDLAEKIYAYYVNRYDFRFNRSLNIDDLWSKFLKELA